MIDQSQFKPTLIDTVLDFFKENNPEGFFKEFFYGNPEDFVTDSLPMLAIEPSSTTIKSALTGMDMDTKSILMRVIYNKRDELGKSSSELPGVKTVELIVEGVDPETNEYDSRTIAGILRKNFTLAINKTGQDMVINYGNVPQANGEWTLECQITFTVEGFKTVTGRI